VGEGWREKKDLNAAHHSILKGKKANSGRGEASKSPVPSRTKGPIRTVQGVILKIQKNGLEGTGAT